MKFEAILFDCDGVLVDSEPITHGVLRELLADSGWDMPLAECMRHFIGRTVRSQAALYPELQLELQPSVGEHPMLVDLLARIALSEGEAAPSIDRNS